MTWSLRAVACASIEPLNYAERLQAAAITSTLQSAITLLYRTDLSITDRILHAGRTFQIQSYQDPSGQQFVLRLICAEVQA